MDPYMDKIFHLLDYWRHLPAYRLEPRADIFFAAFLPEIIETAFDTSVREPIIPEFPFRRGTIYGEASRGPNASVKVDYLVVSEDGRQVFFVELKTDQASFRPEQDEYLDLAVKKGIPSLVRGVLRIIAATNNEYLPKYMHLLDLLERLGWIELQDGLAREVCVEDPPSADTWLEGIRILPAVERAIARKVYILPEAKPDQCCISFNEVAEVVGSSESPMGQIFAKHLRRWMAKAGTVAPGVMNC